MKDILQKFTSPGDLVVDGGAETLSMTKACMLLPQHRRFVEFEMDSACATGSMSQLVVIFAQQVLIKE